jgi:hypothetical protein
LTLTPLKKRLENLLSRKEINSRLSTDSQLSSLIKKKMFKRRKFKPMLALVVGVHSYDQSPLPQKEITPDEQFNNLF